MLEHQGGVWRPGFFTDVQKIGSSKASYCSRGLPVPVSRIHLFLGLGRGPDITAPLKGTSPGLHPLDLLPHGAIVQGCRRPLIQKSGIHNSREKGIWTSTAATSVRHFAPFTTPFSWKPHSVLPPQLLNVHTNPSTPYLHYCRYYLCPT